LIDQIRRTAKTWNILRANLAPHNS